MFDYVFKKMVSNKWKMAKELKSDPFFWNNRRVFISSSHIMTICSQGNDKPHVPVKFVSISEDYGVVKIC